MVRLNWKRYELRDKGPNIKDVRDSFGCNWRKDEQRGKR